MRTRPSRVVEEFTRKERRILAAALERILPSDDGVGARTAGVMRYFDFVRRQPVFEPVRARMQSGLELLAGLSRDLFGKDFVDLSGEDQDIVLQRVASVPHPAAQRFFATLVNLALAGFLCDPTHGGNRNVVGWRFIGYSPRTAGEEKQ
jgi:gluconate 2-dehydrogenase gamma chain